MFQTIYLHVKQQWKQRNQREVFMGTILRNFILTVFTVIVVISSASYGNEQDKLNITGVSVTTNTTALMFNNGITIKGFEIVTTSSRTVLKTPHNIKVETKELEEQIIQALKTGTYTKYSSEAITYQITSIENVVDNKSKVKARVKVIFNDSLSITCGIIDGEKGLWILLPRPVKFNNTSFQKMVESSIIKKYKNSIK